MSSAPSAEAAATAVWVRHAIGKIAACPQAPPPAADIAALIAECGRDELRLTEENFFDESLGPRWQCANRIHRGDDRLVAELRLADEYSADLDRLHLHPALLDRAAGIGLLFLVERSSGYLPFGYGRLRLYAPLRQRVYIYSRGGVDPATDGETTAFDVDILGEDGSVLAQIRKFAHKRINEIGKAVTALMAGHHAAPAPAFTPAAAAAPSAGAIAGDAAGQDADPYQRGLSMGISPAEGVQVFARLLEHKVPAQVVVSPSDLGALIEWARQATPERYRTEAAQLAAPPTHARPGLETRFVAPASALERQLATLWQECLGIDRIGLHDDFFELGGNSVLAIQIMANARKAGLNFSVQQLFQYSTLAELAACVESADGASAHAGGALPALPAQRRALAEAGQGREPAAWSLLLEIGSGVAADELERHATRLLAEHEALRLHFPAGSPPGTQAIAAAPAEGALETVDLRGVAAQARAERIAARAEQARAQLRIGAGPLAKLVLFRGDDGDGSALLIAAHPAAADPGSARILVDALRAAVDRREREASLAPPSYRKAVAATQEFARSALARSEMAYWDKPEEAMPPAWPAPNATAATDAPATAHSHALRLSREDTQALLTQAPRAYRVRAEELILAALVAAVGERSGQRRIRIDCHGRVDALAGERLREVAGPFATVAPVVFEQPAGDDPGALLTAIKEQWRAVPRGGAGYDLVRWLEPDAAAAPPAPIGFSYLGAFDDPADATSQVRAGRHAPHFGPERALRGDAAIEVDAFVHAQQLHLRWRCDPARVDGETAAALASAHGDGIAALARHCAATRAEVVTPSDFPLAGLDAKALQKISRFLEKADESAVR
ncbi:condensation domain-containing protein [Lysobacter enzymogenes]|uniref:condensation domain-containing protein n=1 Tax=Lysobacter enzymogenes TaxID=69 RepID=UPI002264467A|nr:condensation domain-containing protein [Lysobacter enzymogenes]UZW58367.1 polyketide synthase dehydratase domain-containing protein [Lysobacter enzymogenes]